MNKLFTALLLFICTSACAQQYDTNNRFYVNDEQEDDVEEYAISEAGISAGPVFAGNITGSIRLQVASRITDHIQGSLMLSYIGGDLVGPGLNINFPLGTDRSYFYPGVQISYYFDSGVSYGGHLGYTAAISKLISANIEPEVLFAHFRGIHTSTLLVLNAGIRFNF